ncbi:MAG: phage minor head protein [Treponemataceae bacterium]
MSDKFIPKEALDYIKNKNLKIGFSYKDIWHEEHATAFTVAKAMQIDVLDDIKKAVEKAIAEGHSFEHFKKDLKPLLQQKGWWGKKKMIDPLTGDEVNAQLGSDRRLKIIHNTNLRAAQQKAQYEATMASDLHPYLMYRVGNSKKHREQHLAWDGLILPKDDPWWANHLPQREYNCKCYTRAVTENRKRKYEAEGIQVPRKSDGSGGGIIKVQTKAPPEEYRTYYNERKDTIERVPKGVHPSFNWFIGQTSRNAPATHECIKKAVNKVTPKQFDAVVKTLMTNTASKLEHVDFIDNAIKRKLDKRYITSVGFFDRKTVKELGKLGVDIGEHNLIMLEAGLIQSKKFSVRHVDMGNAPSKYDWYNLMDYLLDASIYYDGEKLIYLAKRSESKYMKIVVDISMENKSHKGVTMLLPKVDTMYELDLATEIDRGVNEFKRITTTMKKIR